MNLTFCKKIALGTVALMLGACGDINNSWEAKGGGYIKYEIDDDGPYTIELDKDDVEPPFYVNNSHRYFYFCSRISESERGDQISLMVNNPKTGTALTPVAQAQLNGRLQYVTWLRVKSTLQSPLISKKSTIKFDEIINDSLWTADLDLYFKDCRTGKCIDSLPPIHLTGRLRYWVPADER
ncbi:MAG: hypothetical protein IJ912_06225 [Fibrobacter sp.]|jgi:hypothetical protein|nr:hypothetical protein [Fibrobacter sp.]